MEFLDITFWKGLIFGAAIILTVLIIILGRSLDPQENNFALYVILYGLAIPLLLGGAVLFYVWM